MPRSRRDALVRKLFRGEFARHGAIVFGSTMLVNGFNYLFHFLISRKLGVVDYGSLYAMMAGIALFGVVTSSATMIVVRFAATFRAVGDLERNAALARAAIRLGLVAALVVAVVGAALSSSIAAFLRISDPRVVAAAALVVAASLIVAAVRGMLQGLEDFGAFAISSVIEGGGKAALGVAGVALGLGAAGALFGYTLALALSIAYSYLVLRRHFAGIPLVPFLFDGRRVVITMAGMTSATLAMTALSSVDTLLVKHFFSPDVAGLYSAVSLVGKVLLFVVSFVPTLVLPKATARVAVGRSPVPIIIQAVGITAVISACGLVLLAVAPKLIVGAMTGGAFVAAAPYALPYGVAMALLGTANVLVAYQLALHRFEFVPWLAAAAVAELCTIAAWHPSVGAVIHVLIGGHALALLATAVQVHAPLAVHAPSMSSAESSA